MISPSHIYDELQAAGQPAQLPQLLQGVPCSQSFVQLPADSGALLAMLQPNFSNDELTAAGVLTAAGQLNPALCGDTAGAGPLGMALRQHAGAPPYAFLVGMEVPGANGLPILAMLDDYRMQDRL